MTSLSYMYLCAYRSTTYQFYRTRPVWILGILALLSCSCDSYVEVDVPDSQLFEKTVFEDLSTATAAQLNLYATLRESSLLNGGTSGITYLMGHYADELDLYNSSVLPVQEFNTNSLTPSNTYVSSFWDTGYSVIYGANSILEGVANSNGLSEQEKYQLRGEAVFVRALVHFYLLNLFGDIPYITTTDYRINTKASRSPTTDVYGDITADLMEAMELLPTEYASTDRVRPNKWVCAALLARVYLYAGNFEQAEQVAGLVIDQTDLYGLEPDLNQVFRIDSGETLFQLDSGRPEANTIEALTFIFEQAPPPDSALTPELVNTFENGDQRKDFWTGSLNSGGKDYFYAHKYKENGPTASSEEYSVVFRLAEQYLIRAEARARLGNGSGALQDLNVIRARAGLQPLSGLNNPSLMDAILQERRVELFTEFGHRWFDLKRFDKANEVLAPLKTGWKATDTLLPLPQSELLVNTNLQPQNPGY